MNTTGCKVCYDSTQKIEIYIVGLEDLLGVRLGLDNLSFSASMGVS